MNKFSSRKFIVALLLIVVVVLINIMTFNIIPAASLVAVMPVLFGFNGVILGAIAVMYPASNAFAASKWSKDGN